MGSETTLAGSFDAMDGPSTNFHRENGVDTGEAADVSQFNPDAKVSAKNWPQLLVLAVTQMRKKVMLLN